MITDFYENLVFVEKKSVADGYGGFEITYVDGAEFKGGITTDNSTEMRVAEKNGVTALYTITVDKNLPLQYSDIIKRKSDNKYFKIVSDPDDMIAPAKATIKIKQAQAERWTMPVNK